MTDDQDSSRNPALARQVREQFTARAGKIFEALPNQAVEALEHMSSFNSVKEKLAVMELEAILRQKANEYQSTALSNWRKLSSSDGRIGATKTSLLLDTDGDLDGLALVDNEEMERSIAIKRLAQVIAEGAGQELRDIQARIGRLDSRSGPTTGDVLRPETFARVVINSWTACNFTLTQWKLSQNAIHKYVTQGLREAYKHANALLKEQGVSAVVNLKVRRTPDRVSAHGGLSATGMFTIPAGLAETIVSPSVSDAMTLVSHLAPSGTSRSDFMPPNYGGIGGTASLGDFVYAPPGSAARAQYEAALFNTGPSMIMSGSASPVQSAVLPIALSMVSAIENQRAQGVLGNLRDFFLRHGAALADGAVTQPISPQLAVALAAPHPTVDKAITAPPEVDEPTQIDSRRLGEGQATQAAEQIKEEARTLKNKAERPDEKATIEIVSMMFQAILTDERLPSALRAWFGRLQVPVLRVALSEPEFFAETDHPARRLIDRMGACALGMDSSHVNDNRLEEQVKHIVQLIEQYPDTGKKVFQVALSEFEKFLGSTLAHGKPAEKYATLAQQVEQKDALAIQYTIELRNMLNAVPVDENVRQFMFRVWSEVLALAAVRYGAQDAYTVRLKQTAVDLLWAVTPKSDRAERQQVVQYLPGILKTLREEMQALAMQQPEQDSHIRLINRAVTQAFQSPEPGISPAQMNQLALGLTGLEDVITDDPEGDLLLDPALIEQMLGVGGEDLEVISTGGARPDPDMLQWAGEQQQGQWFTLTYQNASVRVQYVWRSIRGQLHIFSSTAGRCYLIQTRRLASYMQAGLIVPVERESLTIKATREALDRLGQEPQRLLE